MKSLVQTVLFILILTFLAVMTWGEEFHVGNHIEFYDALNKAESNGEDDVIKVAQGTYLGNYWFWSLEEYSITLLGGYTLDFSSRVVNPSNSVIDGTGVGLLFVIVTKGGGDIFIEGFKFVNGQKALFVASGTPSCEGTPISGGNITITSCIIQDNKGGMSQLCGGLDVRSVAVSPIKSKIIITNNVIVGNIADGIAYIGGGGVNAQAYNIILTNNTITENEASFGCGGINLEGVDINIYNNIIWGNSGTHGEDIYLSYAGNANGYNNDYSSMYGSWTNSGNNINSDPQFVGVDDYHLRSTSPCIDAGTNSAPELPDYDFDSDRRIIYGKYDSNVAADIGADEYVQLPIFDGHDFDSNGNSDISVWRSSDGKWYLKGTGVYPWGTLGDIPVNGNYDTDDATEIAVWRPSNGKWYIKDIEVHSWGTSGDIPVPGDYNGDGTTDIAAWRPSDGRWYIRGIGVYPWGTSGDIPVPGDYNGDGTTDIAIWRPSNGRWYIRGIGVYPWGISGDMPVPGDYGGDGTTDIAVWRPSSGKWYIRNIGVYSWGTSGDISVPGDYNGDGTTDIAVWRPSDAKWYIRDTGVYSWGMSGDIPLVR